MNEISKTDQVAKQCRAVVTLANAIAKVHSEVAEYVVNGHASLILDQIGSRSAAIMEDIGNYLNDMDAVTEDDENLDDVFEMARKMFPVENKQ